MDGHVRERIERHLHQFRWEQSGRRGQIWWNHFRKNAPWTMAVSICSYKPVNHLIDDPVSLLPGTIAGTPLAIGGDCKGAQLDVAFRSHDECSKTRLVHGSSLGGSFKLKSKQKFSSLFWCLSCWCEHVLTSSFVSMQASCCYIKSALGEQAPGLWFGSHSKNGWPKWTFVALWGG